MRTANLLGLLLWPALVFGGGLEISLLSSPADMVSGDAALVEVSGALRPSVSLNGRDVSASFRGGLSRESLVARVTGLKLGRNVIEASAGGERVELEIEAYPLSGPIFSGPHQQPFRCGTERAGLGSPLDENCSVAPRVDYYYRSTAPQEESAAAPAGGVPRGFKWLNPSEPRPADLAQATTTLGKRAPYIVRLERGVINRALYQIAFLHDPDTPLPDPWSETDGWNRRLVYRFGGGCKAGYEQGRPSSAIDHASLSRGYAVAASSLNVFGNNCDDVISAETLMMVKEHFIESFGAPLHTIGSGGSGGSMQQHLIAQNYPGLLDGITPTGSYPDIVTLVPPVTDCSLLSRAFEASRQQWTDEQKTAVSGFATWATCGSWMRTFSPHWVEPGSCRPDVPKDWIYDADSNPHGVRCGLHDNQVNVYGRDPDSGLARRALDNVGVQYGLAAFESGKISAEQFIELNESIGGYDADGKIVAERTAADPEALRIAYSTGRVNSAGGSLGEIPIIDGRRYADPTGNIHDRVRTYVLDARLQRANGTADNRVLLTEYPAGVSLTEWMDKWLDSLERGAGRPKDLAEACWTAEGEKISERERCDELYPPHGDPRIAAGAPLTNDILKCRLKPLARASYSRPLSDEQFGRLQAAFPDGVCDYSVRGVGQTPVAKTWRRY